jgi:DNA-binding GntR family transcriptional regulator
MGAGSPSEPRAANSDLTWAQAEEIYQVRVLLEGEAAALCAKRATRDDIEGMRKALSAFERVVRDDDSARRLSATADFYSIMQRGGRNAVIEDLLRLCVPKTLSALMGRQNRLS